MSFKFEKLEVWHLALEYVDQIYKGVNFFPPIEEYNLKSQMIKAATSIALNIAEGSTSQTNSEFRRFVAIALRSCIEVIACLYLAQRRGYISNKVFNEIYEAGGKLFAKLQALRKSLTTTDHKPRTTTDGGPRTTD